MKVQNVVRKNLIISLTQRMELISTSEERKYDTRDCDQETAIVWTRKERTIIGGRMKNKKNR